jgi:hypothetical protein
LFMLDIWWWRMVVLKTGCWTGLLILQ